MLQEFDELGVQLVGLLLASGSAYLFYEAVPSFWHTWLG